MTAKKPIRHGTRLAYRHGCRCAKCRPGSKQRNAELATVDVPHGSTRYNEYGCRCSECRAAMAANMRKVRVRQKARFVQELRSLSDRQLAAEWRKRATVRRGEGRSFVAAEMARRMGGRR